MANILKRLLEELREEIQSRIALSQEEGEAFPDDKIYHTRKLAGSTDVEIEKIVCEHDKPAEIEVTVLGVVCNIPEPPMCASCAERYLNQACTLCASCGNPIFPGNPVGQAWQGAPHPYTHLTFDCCATGALYCGRWGEGKLITLHELEPDKYPDGSSSVMNVVLETGKPITQTLSD